MKSVLLGLKSEDPALLRKPTAVQKHIDELKKLKSAKCLDDLDFKML